MNNDLISRRALLNKMRTIKPPECNSCEYEHMEYVRVEDVRNASAVDAEVVRHGKWLNKTERIYADLNYRFDCSVCSHIFYAAGIETFNYCPNCGAKMLEGEDVSQG